MGDVRCSTVDGPLSTRKLSHGVTERYDNLLTGRVPVGVQPLDGLQGSLQLWCQGYDTNIVHFRAIALGDQRGRYARLDETLFVRTFLLSTDEWTFTVNS